MGHIALRQVLSSLFRMEPIALRSLVTNVVDPATCKLHCAVFNGVAHPIDVLGHSWDEWVNWNRWRGSTNHFNRQFIFSLAQAAEDPKLWLFGGIFEVTGRTPTPHATSYEIQLRPDLLGSYIKRLRVGFQQPGRNTRLSMERHVDNMVVHAVLAEPYIGEPFPGLDQINHTLLQLQAVVGQHLPDWRVALQHMKGVYVIHDQTTGEPYVGAAYGDTGIWQRLCEYTQSVHGNNQGLKELVDREGREYGLANLRFALLEYWAMRTEDNHVLQRETYWKEVLLSRTLGINRN